MLRGLAVYSEDGLNFHGSLDNTTSKADVYLIKIGVIHVILRAEELLHVKFKKLALNANHY